MLQSRFATLFGTLLIIDGCPADGPGAAAAGAAGAGGAGGAGSGAVIALGAGSVDTGSGFGAGLTAWTGRGTALGLIFGSGFGGAGVGLNATGAATGAGLSNSTESVLVSTGTVGGVLRVSNATANKIACPAKTATTAVMTRGFIREATGHGLVGTEVEACMLT